MDFLSQLLSDMKLASTTLSQWRLYQGYGVLVQDFTPGYFLSVVSGQNIDIHSADGVFNLSEGDSIIAVRGGECRISSGKAGVYEPLNELPWEGENGKDYRIEEHLHHSFRVTIGSGNLSTKLFGIAYTFEDQGSTVLTSYLPEFIHLTKEQLPANDIMGSVMAFLVHDKEPGYFAMAKQLATFVVTNSIRSYLLGTQDYPIGVLRGLIDLRLGKALQEIHENFHKKLSVDSLASLSNMSRSSFAENFKMNIGESPIHYLNNVRAQRAMYLLKESRLKTYEIAEKCGFGSDRMLRSVIHKYFGKTPKELRKV